MEQIDNIKEAIEKAISITKEKYNTKQAIYALMNYIINNDSTMFTRTGNARNIISNIPAEDIIKIMQSLYPDKSLKEAIYAFVNETKISENAKMQDVETYPRNIEECKDTIMLGGRLEQQEGDRGLGDGEIFISSRKGNRAQQQDAVIAIRHPKKPEFSLMVVADGMGGMESGDLASDMIIKEMEKWFENLDVNYYYQPDELKTRFIQIINEINDKIYLQLKGKGGSTFVGTIVCENDTIGASVGDSRAYSYANGRIQQLTKDDSLVQKLYEAGEIEQEGDMRFHRESNLLTQCIGMKTGIMPNMFSLKNGEYDCLVLASDGVTDNLEIGEVKDIIERSYTHEIAKTLVGKALTNNSTIRPELAGNSNYYETLKGGQDNATTAVFIPWIKRERERIRDEQSYRDREIEKERIINEESYR